MQKILFYSDLCPDTPPFVQKLEELQIEYEAINITASMVNLKAFLKVRDSRPEFAASKAAGNVGVPVLYAADEILVFDPEELERFSNV